MYCTKYLLGLLWCKYFAIQETLTIHRPVDWYDYFWQQGNSVVIIFWSESFLSVFHQSQITAFLFDIVIVLFSSWSQSNWKHRWRNIMTCEHFVQHIQTPEFYRNAVYVCTHISCLAPPPTQPFCLQARPLGTDSSCFHRWQIRAANPSRVELPCSVKMGHWHH